ncbi:MAG TPA: glycerol-3-phosphate 1-O-acyltransferase PlsY [Gemmatimonadales bacterium]|nr:glycerol-3-phosphate 1-O-acyltransferase PlsY [Gemmatimonadales bacterium]
MNALWIALAYFVGAIPTSYLAGRLRGIDLREQGSKNLGATNTYRVLGWRYAVPVALVDIAKGALPVALARATASPALPVLVGTAAVCGHMFSPYVGFKGGKGVATAGGMFLALAPVALAISAGVWVAAVWLTGYVSVGSLLAAGLFPIWAALTEHAPLTVWTSVPLAGVILFTHRANIRRLLDGTEHRFRTGSGLAT